MLDPETTPGLGSDQARRAPRPGSSWRAAFGLLTAAAAALAAALAETPRQAPGTRRMAERLERLARASDPALNPTLSDRRAGLVREELAAARSPREIVELTARLATELLNAGRPQEAIRELEPLEGRALRGSIAADPRDRRLIRRCLAIAYLRLGERENCRHHHTVESCLLPIRGAGVHRLPHGSREAIRVLRDQLEELPGDLEARWLLNVASMTLGEHPEGVPERWRIDPAAFASEDAIEEYRDVAGAAGVDVDDAGGGSVAEDFDLDGDLDLMASTSRLDGPLRYFANEADGTFSERTLEAGLEGEVGGMNLVHADYDNDGYPDVLVLRGGGWGRAGLHPKSLLRNNGDGTFADVTEEAGLMSLHPTQTAAWLDYDADGRLDLYVGNEWLPGDRHASELFHNNGDGTFTDCAAPAGVADFGYTRGVAAGDFDNDGRPDLYLSREGLPNVLYRNAGPAGGPGGAACAWRFEDVTRRAGVGEPIHSSPTWFFDFDNDGWLDLFVAGSFVRDVGDVAADYLGLESPGERPRLYRNRGDGTFADVTREAGLYRVMPTMGAGFGEIDNDGWPDIHLGTGDASLSTLIPNRLFRNDAGRRFLDVTTAGRVGHLQKGNGISFADLDNDGDQDIYAVLGGAYQGDTYANVLFENPGYGNRWIALRLQATRSNRAGIGARIAIEVETAAGRRRIHRSAGTGGGFGDSPLRQEIGLGRARSIRSVAVTWPSGLRQVFAGVALDRFYLVREGDAEMRPLAPPRFGLGGAGGPPRRDPAGR